MYRAINFIKNHSLELLGGFVALCFVIVITTMAFSYEPNECNYVYEYIDALGNEGIADNCYTDKGNMICTYGNKRMSVVQYEHKYYCE